MIEHYGKSNESFRDFLENAFFILKTVEHVELLAPSVYLGCSNDNVRATW